MREELIVLLTGIAGTIGFCILFYIRLRRMPLAVLGGALTCGVYLLCSRWVGGSFIPNMVGAMLGGLFSSVCARWTKVPSNVYLTPSMVPLLPGGMLYRTMSSFVRGDLAAAGRFGMEALIIAMGISCGIVMSSVLMLLLTPRRGGRQGRGGGTADFNKLKS